METVRCENCSLYCGEVYGTGFYELNYKNYCSTNCFIEFTKKEMDKLNARPQGSGNKVIKKRKRTSAKRIRESAGC